MDEGNAEVMVALCIRNLTDAVKCVQSGTCRAEVHEKSHLFAEVCRGRCGYK